MKNIVTNLVYLFIGLGIGYLLSYLSNGIDNKPIVVTNTVVDTVEHVIKVEVPKYQTKYVTRTDSAYITVFDSIERWTNIYIPDTVHVPINQYRDSIKTVDYRLDYTIETLGYLARFEPTLTVYQRNPVNNLTLRPKWMVSGAISTKGTFKIGAGYRGWTIETELSDRFEKIYFGKQYIF